MLVEVLSSALISGGLNALGKSSARDDQNRKIQEAINALDEIKVSPLERTQQIDYLSDTYDTGIMNTLNKSAVGIALSGAVNPEAVKSGVAGELLGQKESAILKAVTDIEEFNRNIDFKKTELGLNKQSGNLAGDFLEGAIGGAAVGFQISNYIETAKLNDKYFSQLDKIFPNEITNSNTALDMVADKLKKIDTIFDRVKERAPKEDF